MFSLLCSPRLHLFNRKYSENSNIVKYYYYLKKHFLLHVFKNVIYSYDGKAEFSAAITPV